MSALAVVIVTHNHAAAITRTLDALTAQLCDDDELVVVDSGSSDGTAAAVRAAAPRARVLESPANLGFGGGCNVGAAVARAGLLVFLNPDATPTSGWREAVEAPLHDDRRWSAWQALITAQEGAIVNSRGGVVHFTGIAWAGGAGEPAGATADCRGEPGFVSGACLAIRRADFERLGAFAAHYFLYHEDVDLSLRVRLAGGKLGVAREARVDHDYEFEKGPVKWRRLERNRLATIVRTYPAPLPLLLAPALLGAELALVPAAIAGGWWREKLRAWGDVAVALPRLARERRQIQAQRQIAPAEFAAALVPELSSRYLGAAGRSRALAALLRGYWRAVLRLLGV